MSCNFLKARTEVDEFNSHNRWKKRGVAMVPTKFGVSFTKTFMNQVTFVLSSLHYSILWSKKQSYCYLSILIFGC